VYRKCYERNEACKVKIEHLAIWTLNLEKLKDFYVNFFNAKAGNIYINEKTGFKSYFLEFDDGCRLEIMEKPTVNRQKNTDKEVTGLAHFAISVGSKKAVDELTYKLRNSGFKILSEPRTTGDGYYESVIADPDGNRIEITV